MLRELLLLYRKTMANYLERYKYRTYYFLSDKTGTELYDMADMQTTTRCYVNEDALFVFLPSWFLIGSVLSLIAIMISNLINKDYILMFAFAAIILSVIVAVGLFIGGKKKHKVAVFMDTLSAVGLLEIVILVIIYVPLLIFFH